MKLHGRYRKVALAGNAIDRAIWDEVEKHDLTPNELVRILTNAACTAAVMAVRVERHGPESDKGADQA